jgi:hypothetical protein
VAEVRTEARLGEEPAVQGGAGLFADLGGFARGGLVTLVGPSWQREPPQAGRAEQRRARAAGRIEAIARFHVDPFRQARRGVYLGGGVSHLVGPTALPRWQLVALAGVEGGARGGIAPALELGLGGGLRLGAALRRARPARR